LRVPVATERRHDLLQRRGFLDGQCIAGRVFVDRFARAFVVVSGGFERRKTSGRPESGEPVFTFCLELFLERRRVVADVREKLFAGSFCL
jgi:hypothetical protein